MKSLRLWLAAALCLVLMAAPALADPPDLENLVSFGDSLSDSGNVLVYSGGAIPDAGDYWQGRFSNGPTWPEDLADHMGLQNDFLFARMLVPPVEIPPDPPSLFLNCAFGGAVTGELPDPTENSFLTQVLTLEAMGAAIPPSTLVTVWIGGNDILGGGNTPEVINRIVTGTIDGLDILVNELGATHIAVVNIPDSGPLDIFAAANPGVTIYDIDVIALNGKIVSDPDKYGIINTTQAALSEGKSFTEAEGWLWWDAIHPSASAHALIGAYVFGEIFIQAPDPGVDYFPTRFGSGSAIGLAAQQGQVDGVVFLDPAATSQDQRPTDLIHGIARVDLTLSGADTAVFTLYFADPLPADYGISENMDPLWNDLIAVFAATSGAQGAEISGDRRSVVIRILDNGEYDADPAEGQVRAAVAPGISSTPSCFIGALLR